MSNFLYEIPTKVVIDGYGNSAVQRQSIMFNGSVIKDDPINERTIVSITAAGNQNLNSVLNNGNEANNTIKNLSTPVENFDAANKYYVDNKFNTETLSTVLSHGNTTAGYNINLTGNSYIYSSDGNIVLNDTVDVSSNNIKNVATPIDTTDAANKSYVDTKFASENLAQVLLNGNSAGATKILMNNQKISELATPTLAQDATNKGYVDGYFQSWNLNKVLLAGNSALGTSGINMANTPVFNISTIGGNGAAIGCTTGINLNNYDVTNVGTMTVATGINMNSKKIYNLGTPTASTDAATKGYIDGYLQNTNLSAVLSKGNSAGSYSINMNSNPITAVSYIDPVLTTAPAYSEGRLYYDNDEKTLNYHTQINGVSINIGQEQVIYVRNNSGSTITNGSVVYVNGAIGPRPTIALASASATETEGIVIGVVTADIANNANGYVTTYGVVRGLNTSSYAEGDRIYLSTTAGQFTKTKPTGTNKVVPLGIVSYVNPTNGQIFVRLRPIYNLADMWDYESTMTLANTLANSNTTAGNHINLTGGSYIYSSDGNVVIQDRLDIAGGITSTAGDIVIYDTINMMNNQYIINLPTPTGAGYAANKGYVDGYFQSHNLSAVLSKGNSAGSYDINMNNKSITSVNTISGYASTDFYLTSSAQLVNTSVGNLYFNSTGGQVYLVSDTSKVNLKGGTSGKVVYVQDGNIYDPEAINGKTGYNLNITSNVNLNMNAGGDYVAQGLTATLTATSGNVTLNGAGVSTKISSTEIKYDSSSFSYEYSRAPSLTSINQIPYSGILSWINGSKKYTINRHNGISTTCFVINTDNFV